MKLNTLTTNYQLLTTIFIVGPTASGKSELAMRIAEEFNGEIICADSQTIRKGLDAGTAKPSISDQNRIPHHLLDIVEPYAKFSVAEFSKHAEQAINKIQSKNKLPIIVGGAGLYINALLYGFTLRPSTSKYSRSELEAMSIESLQNIIVILKYPMPKNSLNPRHLIRTIEAEGQQPKKQPLRAGTIIYGLQNELSVIEKRIIQRVNKSINQKFIDEIESMIAQYGLPPRTVDAIAYRIALAYRIERGEYDLDTIKQKIIIAERQYAKRQILWFSQNKDIIWCEDGDAAQKQIQKMLLPLKI